MHDLFYNSFLEFLISVRIYEVGLTLETCTPQTETTNSLHYLY